MDCGIPHGVDHTYLGSEDINNLRLYQSLTPTPCSERKCVYLFHKYGAFPVGGKCVAKYRHRSQHGIDCQVLDTAIKPIIKTAIDRNILKKLGDTGKVSECKQRKKPSGSSEAGRRKSSGAFYSTWTVVLKFDDFTTSNRATALKLAQQGFRRQQNIMQKKSGAKRSGGKGSQKSAVDKGKTPMALTSAV
ncbi:hypothetical protein AVEN_199670-1 [Araneus ventricosus]|uniref:Uncharacterized protein n=1 Tax=Araneus ventricosus TaxID=182803 RepID=A0A4Y2DH15_ARAVE|nr:hypothetical protein AVEN_199670-1 [Araneus ventricosus]